MTPHRTTALDGFEQIKKRPQLFRCTLCAGAFVMGREAMITHANEAGHQSKVKEKQVGWTDWDVAWGPVAQDWGEQREADERARWMPSEEELEREKAERDKREWILKWIKGVEEATRLSREAA